MTYQETLDWMFAQLPMYQQKGRKALNSKLDKSLAFDKVLGNPHKNFKSIHVAGTNGKGSCSHMIASVLQEAGYKVGLYTSPHLKDFRERIKVNGQPTSQEFVIEFIQNHKEYLEVNQLSFFEMTVGMAFMYFASQLVDIALVEVGLGGRLDSTNIISPEVCLITNIGLDHTSILGNTHEKIAMEKAGIIKKKIPVVIGERQEKTAPIFELIAAQKRAPIDFADDLVINEYHTDLLGNYQRKNVRSAIATLRKLEGYFFSEQNISDGLSKVTTNTRLRGRWQVLSENPKIVCDTAHNKEGIELVLDQLNQENKETLHIVLGFVSDKNVEELLELFPKSAIYYFTAPEIPRALKLEELVSKANNAGLNGMTFSSVKEALIEAKNKAGTEDLIFVGGSTFVVAEVV